MDQATHNKIVSFIWGIADDVLRDLFVRGKYRDVILPMCVLRRLDAVLEPTQCRAGGAGVCHHSLPRQKREPEDAARADYCQSGTDALAQAVSEPSQHAADRASRAIPVARGLCLDRQQRGRGA